MIIWSRWGIVVLAFVGIGVALGWGLRGIFGSTASTGAGSAVFIGIGLMLSGALLWVFTKRVVGTYIDKPKPAMIWQKLEQPVVNESGQQQTHRSYPVLHPETGQQVWTNPVSTFFFIPLRYWAFVLPAIGLLVFVTNLITMLAGG